MNEVLGIDFGGVITDRARNDRTDTSFFSDNYLQTSAVSGVFEAIRRLVDERFGAQVWIVSKCGQAVQRKTLDWLDYHNFYNQTGIGLDHLRFCEQRREKDGICRELGITHFVDDSLEVLGNLTTVGNLYLFQPRDYDVRRFAESLSRVQQVNSWEEILDDLLEIP